MRRVCARKGCGKSLKDRRPHARFCSRECNWKSWYASNRKQHIARQAKYRKRQIRAGGIETVRAAWRKYQRARRRRLKAA